MIRILVTGAAGSSGTRCAKACTDATRCCASPTSRRSVRRATANYAADIMRAPDTEDAISRQFHGGMYTPMGFDGDPARIE